MRNDRYSEISDLLKVPVQNFLTSAWQLGGVLDRLLSFKGPAKITVSSYSTGEEFLRKIVTLRKEGLVQNASLFLDFKARKKTARINPFARKAFDRVAYCENHSKVLIIEGYRCTAVVLASQNMTRGGRLENYTILESDSVAQTFKEKLASIPTYVPDADTCAR